jgi:hypothetical protein
MAEWTKVPLTYRCEPAPPEGKLYLPVGSTPLTRIVVRTSRGETVLVKGGVRNDQGTGACAVGSTLASLAGTDTDKDIDYRKATFWDVVRYDSGVRLQLWLAILTFLSALITIYATYLKNMADPSNAFTYNTAAVLLVITFLVALGKLYTEFRNA